MKKNILKLSALALTVAFFSCSKDEEPQQITPVPLPTVTDAELAADIQTDLEINLSTEISYLLQQKKDQPVPDKIEETANKIMESINGCDTDGVLSQKDYEGSKYIAYTFDYGTTGCVQENGNTVMGKIELLTANTEFKNLIFIFTDYTVNGKKLNGSITSNKEDHGTNQAKITTTQDLTVHIPVLGEFKRKTDGIVRTYLLGYDTPNDPNDDVFETTGGWVTTFPKGTLNTVSITKKLKTKIECPLKHIEGTIDFTRNENKASIDFGNGLVCAQTWKISRNGKEFDVTVNN